MSALLTSPIPPDLRTLLENLKTEIFYGLNCHQVGVIESFNPATQTASVRISVLKVIGNTQVAYPILTDCPVMFPGGGGAYMTFPVTKGDPCLVLFNDRDLDLWFTTGNVVAPNSYRAHSLSDGMVLVGIRNKTNPPPYTANDAVVVSYGNSSVKLGTGVGGLITIKNQHYLGTGTLTIGSRLHFDNPLADLRSTLDQLCDTLTAWVNTGGSTPNPATLTAIAAVKTKISFILE